MPADRPAIRRIRPTDWPALRALRLEALGDTPTAYLETLEQALALDDAGWQARASRGSEGGDSIQLLALREDRPVGTAVCFVRDGAAWLAAVYLTPAERGRGLLAELVAPCLDWAQGRGRGVMRLEVHEDNGRAQAAYAHLGFAATGRRRPYPLDPSTQELTMERILEAAPTVRQHRRR